MELPYFLVPELSRRLGREVTAEDRANGLAILGLTENEPDLEPNVEDFLERFGGKCEIGSFVLPAELTFIEQTVPVHFKISWAGLVSAPYASDNAPETAVRIEMLTWTEEKPSRPQWSPIGPGIMSNAIMDEIRAGIEWQANKSNAELSGG